MFQQHSMLFYFPIVHWKFNFIKRPYDSDTKLVFSDLLLNFHFYVCLSTNTNAVSGKTVNLAKMTTNSVFLVMVGGQIESGEVGISL